jgi:excisionase family DNA binding protein
MSGLRFSVPVELNEATIAEIVERVAATMRATTADASPWMNINQAADYLSWPKDRIYKLTSAGAIPHRKHGNRIMFRREELDAWLDGFREGPFVHPKGQRRSAMDS